MYYCAEHLHLKGVYYTFIDHFTVEELGAQLAALKDAHDAMLGDRKQKNRRATLAKQMRKVQLRINSLLDGSSVVTPEQLRCRTCSRAECTGACWGFWAESHMS